MSDKRTIEVFSAGCPACAQVIDLVNETACGSCEVKILDMNESDVADRAEGLGIQQVPAVAVNGEVLDCCQGGPTKADLEAAGVGKPTT